MAEPAAHRPSTAASSIADAVPGNWVDRAAPERLRPFLRLARLDRPIGIWLLFWPCAWSSALASHASGGAFPDFWHLILFFVGAAVMRGAGCTYNDILDRDVDALVARTQGRPLPSGQISPRSAALFMIGLSLIGLTVLLQFNHFAILLGLASLLPVAVYPLMKRITHWPQVVLGMTFGWGALMGWAGQFGNLESPAWLLYAAVIAWIVGYDTIYAHQDKEDDALIGLGSTALKFGTRTPYWLAGLYGLAWLLLLAAGLLAGVGPIGHTALALVALQFTWQIVTLDTHDASNCLNRFRSNNLIGLIVFVGWVLDGAMAAAMAG